MPNDHRFVGYPAAVILDAPKGKPVKQLLWGDYVTVTGAPQGDWLPVRSRGKVGWMPTGSLQRERILEIIFVDIGQGDGCLIVTPDDRHILVDAGATDNFCRFLDWRYNSFQKPHRFDAVVISHPDADHYAGFQKVFEKPSVKFGAVYHNGIIERAGKEALGTRGKVNGLSCLTDVISDQAALEALFAEPDKWKGKTSTTMLKKLVDSGRVEQVRMLCAADGHMPGFEPQGDFSIEVLAPVPERDTNGGRPLRWFGDVGKTKNGHSVVLRLCYRDVKILLGGDLNIPAEYHLLSHYTGQPVPPTTAEEERLVIEGARRFFQADVAKSCHHGSADFSDLFLEAVNPIATVISSGDDEPYAHPRADSLGTIGRFSRGARPLIFSTELARSAPDVIQRPSEVRDQLREVVQKIEQAATPAAKEKARKAFEDLLGSIQRSVAVYGAVNLRSDGQRIVMGYKIERPRSADKQWDLYLLEPTEAGVLRYISKYQEES